MMISNSFLRGSGKPFFRSAFAIGSLFLCQVLSLVFGSEGVGDELSEKDWQRVRRLEQQRIEAIDAVIGSVVAIYDDQSTGGGSGVIIDPAGLALTNHHVIMGAGVTGLGGLSDGKMYRWKLLGTDPGGDVALIQMQGKRDFPFTPLGDSDLVRVGDWALAMGNPFILTEDQSPTVTLGIVSGVNRFQPGAGANQLIYGNCIQIDSSINPGNSGGPLFNYQGRVIGINGRGSFEDRGRVNVGLGYAISSNQIKNFIPDLLATKLVEHGTLDASFTDRGGKVICSSINRDARAAHAGLDLGDELIEFEGLAIRNANQFTNLICTLPEDWPTELIIRKPNGEQKTINVRLFGLPYKQPPKPRPVPPGRKQNSEEEQQIKRQRQMIEMLAAKPGTVRFAKLNRQYAKYLCEGWRNTDGQLPNSLKHVKLVDTIQVDGVDHGEQELWFSRDGKFRIHWTLDDHEKRYLYDGSDFYFCDQEGSVKSLSLPDAKSSLPVVQAVSMAAAWQANPFLAFGEISIDGSGKAQRQNAYRMKIKSPRHPPFFAWLRMADDHGKSAPRILKASSHKDCLGSGGVLFSDWQSVAGINVPQLRQFVKGLAETNMMTLKNRTCEQLADPGNEFYQSSTLDRDLDDEGVQP